ncbi:MAG TPA: 1-(5-phosphoribosyl)-5-[(5-phosphoribosylamino)methylideneamino]imidazole-4-carboxamide isomerase [Solirubrobacteraceae bacterium]|nr:1-(5-phosphoribosyl)-5-[(5-phosphoribosylamino)methylideneamino]imidazole-4-carboxamide isomerase [Solirubrobacteraceae bacterium]
MILLAAVDILEGKAVRLTRGEFDQRTVYDADPLEAARRWVAEGARSLHVVDLDGARRGAPVNIEHVWRITAELPVPVQVGGGLRNIGAVREAIEAGAARVVIGTAAYQDIDFLDAAIAEFDDRVVVSIDARAGRLAGAGWTEQTDIPIEAVIEQLGARGVRRYVYSSIDRDGMLAGPDLEGARRVAETVRGTYAYSGGIASLEDLRSLVALRQVNLNGVIVGKALYERQFTIADGQAVLDGEGR